MSLSSSFVQFRSRLRRQGWNPPKESAKQSTRKRNNATPSSSSNSRFGGIWSVYPIHSPIVSNNQEIPCWAAEACLARCFRPFPSRTTVSSFVRGGMFPPRNVIAMCQKCYRSFSYLSFTGKTTHSEMLECNLRTIFQGVDPRRCTCQPK